MASESILTAGYDEEEEETTSTTEETYLVRDNYLSEYEEESEKAIVRDNLGVASSDNVYTKTETDTLVSETIREIVQEHLNSDDPHGILPQVVDMISDFVKDDGSTPFTAAQSGVYPTKDAHLATKEYVDDVMDEHLDADDPHGILSQVTKTLKSYVTESDVYQKSELYTQDEVDSLLKSYVKRDGTTSFTKAQVGVDPTIDSHLATKRYVDKELYAHEVDVDPHGFISTLNTRLASYAKTKNVYDKTQTYSRTQIDSLLNSAVDDAVEASLASSLESVEDEISTIKEEYVKADGSVPFTAPQEGVAATTEDELVTLGQLNEAEESIQSEISSVKEELNKAVWYTSGPVETTVGFVEDNTEVPSVMSMQEILDAIFYGKGVSLTAPDYATIGKEFEVTLCVHGSTALMEYAELLLNDEVVYQLQPSDFADGCITVTVGPIYEDSELRFVVYYTNGASLDETKTVKCSLPVFVGLLPKWKAGTTVTMEYLEELETQDADGTENRFINGVGDDLTAISFYYEFEDAELRHPFIVVPASYPALESMTTSSQSFGLDAFDVIEQIPLEIEGTDVIYTIYIYKQALSSLSQEVTYNFASE